jgi:hypothetical protein
VLGLDEPPYFCSWHEGPAGVTLEDLAGDSSLFRKVT